MCVQRTFHMNICRAAVAVAAIVNSIRMQSSYMRMIFFVAVRYFLVHSHFHCSQSLLFAQMCVCENDFSRQFFFIVIVWFLWCVCVECEMEYKCKKKHRRTRSVYVVYEVYSLQLYYWLMEAYASMCVPCVYE